MGQKNCKHHPCHQPPEDTRKVRTQPLSPVQPRRSEPWPHGFFCKERKGATLEYVQNCLYERNTLKWKQERLPGWWLSWVAATKVKPRLATPSGTPRWKSAKASHLETATQGSLDQSDSCRDLPGSLAHRINFMRCWQVSTCSAGFECISFHFPTVGLWAYPTQLSNYCII